MEEGIVMKKILNKYLFKIHNCIIKNSYKLISINKYHI